MKTLKKFLQRGITNTRWYSKAKDFSLKINPELVNLDNQISILQDAVTPLHGIPYEKQLDYKFYAMKDIITDIGRLVKEFKRKSVINLGISPSPVTKHYRNKDEYNVRKGVDGDPITYGLFIGKLSTEPYAVRPDNIIIIKPLHNEILKVFESFVKKSPFPPCYSLEDGGYWRRALVRSNSRNETMLIVVNHPRDRSQESIEEEQRNMLDYFNSVNCSIDSIYYQLCKHVRCTDENSDLSLIHGAPYLYEDFLGCKFRISPNSFFQINVKAAEVLHNELIKLADFRDTTTVLDLGCGVGTFSIIASKIVRNCIGIDHSVSSIEDAIHNASLNQISNCQFIPGAIETRLKLLFASFDVITDIIVIANPGRAGLHPRVIRLLRENPLIKKILYISCKPDHLMTRKNFIELMENDKWTKTAPFKLTAVKGVDLFPHTFHYEMILKFERELA